MLEKMASRLAGREEPLSRQHESERVGGNLRPRRDPLPLAELIGVAHRAVPKAVAGGAHAADRAIDTMHNCLVVDVDDTGGFGVTWRA